MSDPIDELAAAIDAVVAGRAEEVKLYGRLEVEDESIQNRSIVVIVRPIDDGEFDALNAAAQSVDINNDVAETNEGEMQ